MKMNAPKELMQVVRVISSGRDLGEYEFIDGELEIDLMLDDSGADVDINFQFSHEFPLSRNLFKKAVQFYKPRYVAARIISVTMS
jgi:hypothetical protein